METGRSLGPTVVAMKGHPGTGKSTLARAVAVALGWPLLDKDDIRDCTLPLQRSLAVDDADALLNDFSYSALFRVAEAQLDLGLSVVVDSPLSRRAHLDRLAASAGRVVVVECRPGDEAEWRRRLEGRGRDSWHKPAAWDQLRRLVEGYDGCNEYDIGGAARMVVDTTAAETAELAAAVVQFVRSRSLILHRAVSESTGPEMES